MENERLCSRAYSCALAGVVLLVFASVIAFGSFSDVSSSRTTFEHRAQQAFDRINSASDIVEGVLVSLGVPTTRALDLSHVEVVAQAVLSDYHFVTAMGRYTQLAAADRPAFETRQQHDLWQYQFGPGDDVAVARATHRALHFPVVYATGRQGALQDLVGLDFASDPALVKALGDSLASDQSSLVSAARDWSAGGQLWVLGGGVDSTYTDNSRAGHWVELDVLSMVLADAEWPAQTMATVELIAHAFEFDESTDAPQELINAVVGQPSDDAIVLPFLQPQQWTGVFDVGGHTLRATFVQRPTISWQNLSLNALLATLSSLVVLLIFLLNKRRRAAVAIQQAQVAKLHRAQQQASVTLASIRDTVITLNRDGAIVYANAAAEDLLKVAMQEIVNHPVDKVLNLTDDRRDRDHPNGTPVKPDFLTNEQATTEFNLCRPGGEQIAVSQTNSPIFDLGGEQSGNVLVLRDISVERELTAALKHQANHDSLTGIANRMRFEQVMGELFSFGNVSDRGHALCLIDLDQFKIVNDTCGHAAGDELLVELVDGLRRNVREHDLMARLGGDEFAIVIRDCSAEASDKVVQRVYRYFQSAHFQHSGTVFPVRASIGFVHFKPDETAVEELLLVADAACYDAKRLGRNQVCKRSVSEQYDATSRQGIDFSVVRDAVASDGFELSRRQVSSIDGERILATEFRLALGTEDGHRYGMSEIGPVAERHGMIIDIDRWMIDRAVADYARHQQSEDELMMVSLSAATLCDLDVVESIQSTVKQHKLCTQRVCLDLGEDALLKDLSALQAGVQSLHTHGFKISVSCFAASVSSITSLAAIPVDFIKLDLSQCPAASADSVRLLAAALGVAQALGAQLIIDNVHDTPGFRLCEQVGVRWISGSQLPFAFGKAA